MFGGLGMSELVVIFMVVLLLFGAKRLPEIGSSLGKGIREFKSSIREIEGELKVPPERRVPEPRRDVNQSHGSAVTSDEVEGEGPRKLSVD
jgi:sec-independent protein translocase protein TatA